MIVVSTTGNLDFSHCGDYTERKSRHGEKNVQISIVTWKIAIQEWPQIMITYGVQAVHYFSFSHYYICYWYDQKPGMHILIILILLKIQLETPTKLCAQNHYTNVKISIMFKSIILVIKCSKQLYLLSFFTQFIITKVSK